MDDQQQQSVTEEKQSQTPHLTNTTSEELLVEDDKSPSPNDLAQRKFDENELMLERLVKELELWKYKAKRNRAMYTQIVQALAQEGISVFVEGDGSDLSDDDEDEFSLDSVPTTVSYEALKAQDLSFSRGSVEPIRSEPLKSDPLASTSKSFISSKLKSTSAKPSVPEITNYGIVKSPPKPHSLEENNPRSHHTKSSKSMYMEGSFISTSSPPPVNHQAKPSIQEYPSATSTSTSDILPEENLVSDDELAQKLITENVEAARKNLPALSGILLKRSPNMLRQWQKRHFWVRDFKLYYSHNEVKSGKFDEEKLSQDKKSVSISLVTVHSITEKPDSEDSTEFQVRARDPRNGQMRTYILKAESVSDRDRWVRGLNAHRDCLMSTLRWASSS